MKAQGTNYWDKSKRGGYKNMKKKTIAGLIAIVTIAMFAGCIEEPPSAPTVTQTPTVTPTTTKATPTPTSTPKTELSLGECAIYDDVSLVVVKYEFVDSFVSSYKNETIYPLEGAKFLMVWVKGENIGELKCYLPQEWSIDLLYKDTSIRMRGGHPPKDSYCGRRHGVYPGVSEEGWIVYEVPKSFDVSQAKIYYGRDRIDAMWNLTS